MRKIVSHGFIVTVLTNFAEYTDWVQQLAHRYHAEWILPDWVNESPLVLNIAFAIICSTMVSHAIPIVARSNIALSKVVLACHSWAANFWRGLCTQIEHGMIEHTINGLRWLLAKAERLIKHTKAEDE